MQSTCIQSRPSLHRPRAPASRPAFTLVELLVVIGIISLLISILLPVLGAANRAAKQTKCLSNMRNMLLAAQMYAGDNKNYLIQAGMSHGGAHSHEDVAWFNTLQSYYQNKLVARCPSDDSPHWAGGTPVPPSASAYRRTSYGINEFLDKDLCPWGGPYVKITQIRQSSATIQFLEMAENGDFAGADHPHVDLWVGNVPAKASSQLEIHQHGGKTRTWQAKANYGFLDCHVETLPFSEVFTDRTRNKFDPAVAQ